MGQYISLDDLVAEIEKCEKICEDYMALHKDAVSQGIADAKRRVYQQIIDFINTLEVKEVHDIWHDVTEKPELEQPLLIVTNGTHKDFKRQYRIGCYGKRANDIPTWVIAGCYSDSFISKWCYISDILQYTSEAKEVNNVWNNASDFQKAEAGRSILLIEDNGHAELLKSPSAERLFYFRSANLKMWAYVDELLSITTHFEVKEVDLKAELNTWRHNHFHGGRDFEASGEYLERITQLELAKHFLELGLNSQRKISYVPNIDDSLKELGVDPDSKEAKIFKESYYTALEKLKAQKGE